VISSGEIFATALYLVPRYENRRKSLSEANSKLKNTIESANLSTHIVELRQNALNAELLRIEELKKAEQAQTGKRKLKKEVSDKKSYKESLTQVEPTSTRFSIFEEELNTGGKSLFSIETDTQNPESGKKLWD
jgi:hypothetical protein